VKTKLLLAICTTLFLIQLPSIAAQLVELFGKPIPKVCWGLSVSDVGTVATIEVDGTNTVLATYSSSGNTLKRWTPPLHTQFEACSIDGELVLAQYGDSVALFDDNGRNQNWGKAVEDLWSTSVSLSLRSERVVFANAPLSTSSTVWCYNTDGDRLWSARLQSSVTDSAVSEEGHVAVGGERYGPMYDQGVYAVYLYSSSGDLLWRVATDSPVIDVDLSVEAEVVVAGLDRSS